MVIVIVKWYATTAQIIEGGEIHTSCQLTRPDLVIDIRIYLDVGLIKL